MHVEVVVLRVGNEVAQQRRVGRHAALDPAGLELVVARVGRESVVGRSSKNVITIPPVPSIAPLWMWPRFGVPVSVRPLMSKQI